MLSPEILQKIKHIQITTRRLLSGSMIGDSRSAVKGSGLEFETIREYQVGDDVRFIDWNASARMNKLLVKQYIEERNRTIFLAVDISASSYYSSSDMTRRDLMAQIASVLTLVAEYGKDTTGLLLFSDTIEHFIPINKGSHHVHSIMEKLFTFKPKHAKTNLNVPLNFIASLKRRDVMTFVLSDFIAQDYEKSLGMVSKRFDVVAIRCSDKNEIEFPHVGFLTLQDSETSQQCLINATSSSQNTIHNFLEKFRIEQNALFARYGVDCIDVSQQREFIGQLIRYFRRAMRY